MAFGKKNPALQSILEIFERINSHMDNGDLASIVMWISKTDHSPSLTDNNSRHQ